MPFFFSVVSGVVSSLFARYIIGENRPPLQGKPVIFLGEVGWIIKIIDFV